MRRLAELGHSTAAFLSAPRGMAADTDRLRYFRRLARELGVRPVIVYSPLTITDVRKATATLLTRRGGSDGDHHQLIGHDDLPTSELLDPPLATIRLNGQEIGPGADGAVARPGSARRLRRPGGTGRTRFPAGAGPFR